MSGAYIQILQGDSYSLSTDVTIDGVEQNIAGASLWFLAKEHPDLDADSDAIINASTANGQIAISGNNSSVVWVNLNSNTTANYAEANVLFWALKVQTAAGEVYTLDRGRACVVVPVIITN